MHAAHEQLLNAVWLFTNVEQIQHTCAYEPSLPCHVQLRQSLGWPSVLVGVAPSSSGGGAVALDANGAAAAAMFTPTPNARNRAMLAECKRFAKRVRALHGDLSSWSKHVGGAHGTGTCSCMLDQRLHGQRGTSPGRCHTCKPV